MIATLIFIHLPLFCVIKTVWLIEHETTDGTRFTIGPNSRVVHGAPTKAFYIGATQGSNPSGGKSGPWWSILVFLTGIGQSVFKLELPKVQIRVLEIVFLSKNKEANSWVPP